MPFVSDRELRARIDTLVRRTHASVKTTRQRVARTLRGTRRQQRELDRDHELTATTLAIAQRRSIPS